MKAVLRLIAAYFTGTALGRGITALGVLGVVGGCALFLYLPPLVASQGGPARFSLAIETVIRLLPVAGVLGVVFGAALLPTLFARLASSHCLYVLPYGRAKLLASTFATLLIAAAATAGVVTVYYVRTPLALGTVFERAFVVALLTVSVLYVVLWLTGVIGNAIGLLVGSFATIATLVVPLRFIALPTRSLVPPAAACAIAWALFACGFLLVPRHKARLLRLKQTVAARLAGASYHGGGEVAFLIGTARPGLLAAGQVVPALIATYFLSGFEVMAPSAGTPWLFFLTILSVLAGAIASVAATRSRRLWLRTHWTRAQLFRRIEDAFWRHNSYSLGVLLVLLVALGTHFYLPTSMLAIGMGLLALGTALSTYLGLLITARIGWGDATLAVATMLALMGVAVYASSPATPIATLIAAEAALTALAAAFRELARRRWANLDWMLCRAEPGVRAAA